MRTGQTFKVGDGVRWGYNGDSYPGTVLFVSDSGRQVYVSKDTFKVIDNLGGYVEGDRTCEFTTVDRPIEQCTVWTLRKSGYFTEESGRHSCAIIPGRAYSYNPHV